MNRVYDWKAIASFHASGNSLSKCMAKFGFARRTWALAINRGELKVREIKRPISILKTNSSIKRRLLKDGKLKNHCYRCGISSWNGQPLSLHLHHKNGKSKASIEDLELLCPNCHSQTCNWGGRAVFQPHDERSANTKLTNKQVRQIRKQFNHISMDILAKRYNVAVVTIWKVVRRKTYTAVV